MRSWDAAARAVAVIGRWDMRRLVVTLATVAMGLTGSLGLSTMTATHAAAASNVPARGCGWDCRGGDRWCDWGCRDHRDRCDWGCRDRDRHNRCDWRWDWDCRGRW
jgi:hypothetical protein